MLRTHCPGYYSLGYRPCQASAYDRWSRASEIKEKGICIKHQPIEHQSKCPMTKEGLELNRPLVID